MRRGGWARRPRLWISLLGGVGINALLLASLTLFQRPLPTMDDSSLVVSLEQPEARRRTSPRPPSRSAGWTGSPVGRPTAASAPDVAADQVPPPATTPAIDPAWAVDGGAWTDPARAADARAKWVLHEGGPYHRGRYRRACLGLTGEHMTDEEKDRCYGEWREAELRWERRFGGAPAKPPPAR